jgi:hypothetical protein
MCRATRCVWCWRFPGWRPAIFQGWLIGDERTRSVLRRPVSTKELAGAWGWQRRPVVRRRF